MLQLCYASTYINNDDNLIEDIRNILITARNFNKAHQITGVLYYAEGFFFQCLEGEKESVEDLFTSITKDIRHTNVHRFKDQIIEQTNFKDWSMKYVQKNSDVKKYFSTIGFEKFKPHILEGDQLKDMLKILYEANENTPQLSNTGYLQRGYFPYL
jgi:hypothetical protein